MKLRLIVLFSFGSIIANGQTSTNSTGGEIAGTGGRVAYSLGQLATMTNKSESGKVLQGIHIGYIDVIIKEDIAESIVMFPNPTKGDTTLALRLKNISSGNITYQLVNRQGQLLFSDEISSNSTVIPTTNLNSGIYFLTVKDNQSFIKTLKIIKN